MSDTDWGVNEVTVPGEEAEMKLAKMVAEILTDVYPVHMWHVGWQGGAIVIKHAATDNRFGFILPREFSYSELRRNVLLGGGELLERAGLTRGAWDGEMGRPFEQ